jgi:probable DNA metabolism protein
MVFLYDGTFAGLLTVLARVFAWDETPEEIRPPLPCGEPDLFTETTEVPTEPQRAARFLAAVEKRTSRQSARNLFSLHASEVRGAEMAAWRYLALGRQLGPALDGHLAHPDVSCAHRLVQRVHREAHRLKGLIRFRELSDGLLYAPVEPDHAVLPFLAPHFACRLPRESWLIHDLSRGVGALGHGGEWRIGEVEHHATPVLGDEEALYQELWRRFFSSVAIPERRSDRRQRQFMPKKYWRHLVEMD